MNLQNEASNIYRYDVSMDMLDGNVVMKPCGYQKIICDVAEMHLNRIHLNVDDLAKYNVSWVLVSSSFEIITPIRSEISLIGRTWHSEQNRLTFRRDLAFTDQEGRPLFHAATFTVLMDLTARRIVRSDRAGFEIGEPFPQFTMEASPKLRSRAEMQVCDHRRIYPSYIDCLGHTNNGRYSEFAYDALTPNELENLADMRRMDLYFTSELKLGDTFTVRRSSPEITGGELMIDGINDETGKQSFACKMLFAYSNPNQ